MTTAAPPDGAQAPPTAKKYALAPPRGKLKTGMPTDGLWILAGLPKAGKTTLAASIPACPLLELERGGADRVEGWVQEIPDLATFRLALAAAVADPNVSGVAIDSLDKVEDWFEAEVCELYGLESISERKEGVNGFAVWGTLRERWEGLLGYLKRSGKFAVLIAHTKEPRIDGDGKVLVPAGITLPGKIGGYVAAEADAIGNCYKKQVGSGTKYFVSFQGGPLGTWGSRIEELEDKTVELPRKGQWAAIAAVCAAPAPKAEAPAPDKKAKPTKGAK